MSVWLFFFSLLLVGASHPPRELPQGRLDSISGKGKTKEQLEAEKAKALKEIEKHPKKAADMDRKLRAWFFFFLFFLVWWLIVVAAAAAGGV